MSVSQTPGRDAELEDPLAWPGVTAERACSRAVEAMARKVDAPRTPCLCCEMHVSFALFADAANLSQEGKLNVLGVFDALQVASLPAVHPRAHLVVHLKGTGADIGQHTVRFRWINPRGQELWTSAGEVNVGAPPPGVAEMDLPLIAQVDLPLDAVGAYRMDIAIDDEHTLDVGVHVRTPPAMPTGGMVS